MVKAVAHVGIYPELEKSFAHRGRAVENSPGFLGFQLLRPVSGDNRYFIGASLLEFEVVMDVAGKNA
ncbi:antibiotic biosynthesis monooxygenase family protein [Nocardia sp. NPDC059091]|uniref:antibiotic biosynthesis monooxygenase family protein n=1 Tax=unclassified Nocardia TaxID=2637762 RepID=UPI0036BDD355